MEQIVFSVRCTREEYMTFAVKRYKNSMWFALCGLLLLFGAMAAWMIQQVWTQMLCLVILLGLFFLTLESLWLPLWRKGAAGRRYDASDALKQAVSVVVTPSTMTVHTACEDATLPLSAVTQVINTKEMTAILFGKEFTVYIPLRALQDEEWTTLRNWLTASQAEKS